MRAERELAALREEQQEIARRHIASESKRVADEEMRRVGREMDELRKVVAELEQENARGARLREQLSTNADDALASEVERLSAEVRTLRAGLGKQQPPSGPAMKIAPPPAGDRAGSSPNTPTRPPKAAPAPKARASSRGRGRG